MPSMRYLRVVNWENLQHYKKRNPPWIKLHRDILDSYEFTKLPDETKFHLLGIWLLASKTGNRIPSDNEWIKHRLAATSNIDLDTLIEGEFIEYEDSSILPATHKQNAPLDREETETETETEIKTETHSNFDILWKKFLVDYGSKGSRQNAEKQFVKLKPDEKLFNLMIQHLEFQINEKKEKKAAKQFYGDFPHVERWIKDKRWEDELAPVLNRKAENKIDFIEKHSDRSWAE